MTLNLPTSSSRLSGLVHTKHNEEYPELYSKVFLVGQCFRAGAVEMLVKAKCTLASSIEDCDFVLYLGGEDIHPSLYGEKPIRETYFNMERDKHEIEVFNKAVLCNKVQVGICRGFQLIHALNKGKLYQHVDGHGMSHPIVDLRTNEVIISSSMHHQQCIFDQAICVPIAFASNVGTRFCTQNSELIPSSKGIETELEAAYYPQSRCIGVQGHPEVGGHVKFTKWFLQLVKDFQAEVEIYFDPEENSPIGHNSKKGVFNKMKPKIRVKAETVN